MRNSLLTILFTYVTVASVAQLVPVTMPIHTPHGTINHTYYTGSNLTYFYGQSNISLKYAFRIVLKNDSSFTAKTKIEHTSKIHTLTVKNGNRGKQTIFPADTKEIARVALDGSTLYGIPADSCWLFKAKAGRINSYSFLAEQGMDYVIAIQEGNEGPIVPLTKENLLAIVGDDPKLVKLIERNKLTKAIVFFNYKK